MVNDGFRQELAKDIYLACLKGERRDAKDWDKFIKKAAEECVATADVLIAALAKPKA